MTGVEADALARDVIDAAGFGEYFGHGLGHGVGLEVHEAPRLVDRVDGHARAGQRRHDRAGDLPAGLGGVRIEDLAVVRDDGVELLTAFPKDSDRRPS